MASHHDTPVRLPDPPHIDEPTWQKGRSILLGLAAIAWIAAILGYVLDPKQFHFSYLVGFCYFTFIALGALFFVMLQHLGSATWSVTVRRLAENAASVIPLAAVLAVPVVLGLHTLYEWTHTEVVAQDPILQAKQSWLNEPFFVIRMFVYIGIWSFFALRLYRYSIRQDEQQSVDNVRGPKNLSGVGMVVLFVTSTLAAYDWLMSLEPHWYSTMFGVYIFAGGALGFIATLTLVAMALRQAGVLANSITMEHYHDLGKLLFAFTVFWAYAAFSQYMLIWYGNLPEETIWFKHRSEHGWAALFYVLAFGKFLVPFVGLMSRWAKRSLPLLGGFAAWMLLMEFFDMHWVVLPVLHRDGFQFHWIDLACWAAVGSTYGLVFWSRLRKHAIAPVGDYKLAEALTFKNI